MLASVIRVSMFVHACMCSLSSQPFLWSNSFEDAGLADSPGQNNQKNTVDSLHSLG